MQNLILGDNRIAFLPKIEIFHFIAKTNEKAWLDSYKGTSTLKKDLIDIMEQRNIFAHRIVDTSSSFTGVPPDGTLRFVTFKNDVNFNDYNQIIFESLVKKIKNVTDFIIIHLTT